MARNTRRIRASGGASALVPREADTRLFRRAVNDAARVRPVAVIDCGTSAVRASLVEIRGDAQRILEDIVQPADLTAGLTGGKLDHEAMCAVVEAFQGIARAMAAYGIRDARAVATSALREAVNSDVLVERVRAATGIDLEIIDGAEEARLYHGAVSALFAREKVAFADDTLVVDLGGGSTCLGLVRDGRLVRSTDEHYGTQRVWEDFAVLRDSDDFAVSVDRHAKGAARMMLGRFPVPRLKQLVVNGGDVRRLLGLVRPDCDAAVAELPSAAVERWWSRMEKLSAPVRAERCACDAHGAGLLLPAAALIRHFCAAVRLDRVLVPQLTLRDGLLADLRPGALGPSHLDRDQLVAEAKALVERYGGDLPYAGNTASLAVQIFEQTLPLHRLGARERTLLEFAALTHDIGAYINVRNRHKHTMYLLEGSEIAGLTRGEKRMVAQIARYHRRSPPQPHHADFQSLPRRDRVVVRQLAGMLRIAYALDVERSQRIRRLSCEIAGGRLLVRVDRRQIALERVALAGKKELFEETFGLRVDVVPRAGE